MQNAHRWNVLLVDEVPEDSVILHHILETLGSRQFLVTVAQTAAEAERALEQRQFDLVLVTLTLLGAPTPARIDALRRTANGRARVVVSGGAGDRTRLADAQAAGADGILQTDQIDPKQVLIMLRHLMNGGGGR